MVRFSTIARWVWVKNGNQAEGEKDPNYGGSPFWRQIKDSLLPYFHQAQHGMKIILQDYELS